MRTTIDLPDALFRKTKASAALRGTTMKELIIAALERDLNAPAEQKVEAPRPPLLCLPLVRLSKGKKLNLEGLDFDDLLA
jgi:hypothetical protein